MFMYPKEYFKTFSLFFLFLELAHYKKIFLYIVCFVNDFFKAISKGEYYN